MGESPGIRNRCSERRNQAPLVQNAPGFGVWMRRSGSTYPTIRSSPCSKIRASRARSPSSFSSDRQRVHVHRQPSFPPEIVPDVFVRGDGMLQADTEQVGELRDEPLRLRLAVPVVDSLVGNERVVVPYRQAVAPPPAAERPARQRFAGIPLALSEMQQTAGREMRFQPPDQASRPARASSDRGRRDSIRRRPCHRWRRTSARRPSSAARRRRRVPGRHRGRRLRSPAIVPRCMASSPAAIRKSAAPSSRGRTPPRMSSTAPVTGAALAGPGVAASGMWPSPARRPEVGSSPTQPAPGR